MKEQKIGVGEKPTEKGVLMVMGLKISSQKQNLDCYNDAMIGSNGMNRD